LNHSAQKLVVLYVTDTKEYDRHNRIQELPLVWKVFTSIFLFDLKNKVPLERMDRFAGILSVLLLFLLRPSLGLLLFSTTTTTKPTHQTTFYNGRVRVARSTPFTTCFPLGTATTTTTTTTILSSSPFSFTDTNLMLISNNNVTTPAVAVIVIIAVGLLIAAQSFINQMLEGDQGLAAFLKDGSGYNKSAFRSMQRQQQKQQQRQKSSSKDPLPWLKLPQLDFVDVAGQETAPLRITNSMEILEQVQGTSDTDEVYQELEQLRLKMNREVQEENIEEAKRIQSQLEKLMNDNGIEYKTTAGEEGSAFQ
jgi:hypothetical protein